MREIGAAFAVAHHHRQAGAGHVGQNQRGGLGHVHHTQARFELLALVAFEFRPALRAGNDFGQIAHHLAAVAHAQREGVLAVEKGGKLVAQLRVEQHRFGPAFARAEHVAVAEAAASGQHLEIGQLHAPSAIKSLMCTS